MINLIALRGKKSRHQVANAIGIPMRTYAHYELGERQAPYDVLFKLADYFGVSIDCLLGREIATPDTNASPTEQPPVRPSLSEKEKELLTIYRACDPGQQGQIRGYAQALLEEKQRQERRQA